MSVKSIQKWLA